LKQSHYGFRSLKTFNRIGKLPLKIKTKETFYNICDLCEGRNLFKNHIIIKNDDLFRVFNRVCDHDQGRLSDKNGRIVCPLHGWDFVPETSSYTNCQVVKKEENFLISENKLIVKSLEETPYIPRKASQKYLKILFFSHACLLIETKDFSFATDPWIEGFAFASGWWVNNSPVNGWKEKLNAVDFIYISHNHSDHLNEFTLSKVRKDMLFIIPDFRNKSVEKLLIRFGFKNFKKFDLQSYYQLDGTEFNISILPSGDSRDDSGFYLTYGDFSLLSTVDSNDLNSSRLPEDITVFASSFSAGASGYPLCFETIKEADKKEIVYKNLKAEKVIVAQNIKRTKPHYFLPYAGFFSEKAQRDYYIKENNKKNTITSYEQIFYGDILNVEEYDEFNFCGNELKSVGNIHRDIDSHKSVEEVYRQVFKNTDVTDYYIENFFINCKFKDNLIVFFQLTNDNFNEVKKSFYVDFSSKNVFVRFVDFDWEEEKSFEFDSDSVLNPKRKLRIKVRQDSFNWVIKNNLPFEDLVIGFQCRIDRTPDIYNLKFWDHFTNVYI
jgi:CMP-N-acetylneuraminate monooxygenase